MTAETVPTPAELLARADALRPRLVAEQAEVEERTYYSEEMHGAFREAGFYRILVPRRYGGFEHDLPTFWKVVVAIARGCPSTAWCLCLAAGHALQAGSWFGEEAQDDFFATGEFLCPGVAAPVGTAARTEDGWELDAVHPYSSGAPYANWYMGQTFTPDGRTLLFIAPRSAWTMLDDWRGALGLRGSGSHSVRFDHARIPARYALEDMWMVDVNVDRPTPGYLLHGNPMYAGRTLAFFQGELSAITIGAVKGAIDEYEQLVRTRKTQRPPIVPRYQDPDYQRWLGLAIGRVATAEAALVQCGEQWTELCRRGMEEGPPFSREEDLRLNIVGREAMALAWNAMQDLVYRTAGSSAARAGQRMERLYRDTSMAWGHFTTLAGDWTARELAKERFGLVGTAPRPDAEYYERRGS